MAWCTQNAATPKRTYTSLRRGDSASPGLASPDSKTALRRFRTTSSSHRVAVSKEESQQSEGLSSPRRFVRFEPNSNYGRALEAAGQRAGDLEAQLSTAKQQLTEREEQVR